MEHNLLASSRLYLNIKFEELGLVLGVDAERAEAMARSMIEEGRMQVSLIHLYLSMYQVSNSLLHSTILTTLTIGQD